MQSSYFSEVLVESGRNFWWAIIWSTSVHCDLRGSPSDSIDRFYRHRWTGRVLLLFLHLLGWRLRKQARQPSSKKRVIFTSGFTWYLSLFWSWSKRSMLSFLRLAEQYSSRKMLSARTLNRLIVEPQNNQNIIEIIQQKLKEALLSFF